MAGANRVPGGGLTAPTLKFMKNLSRLSFLVSIGWFAMQVYLVGAESLAPSVQAKVDAEKAKVEAWAADPVLVKAVKEHNGAAALAMTQDAWKGLSVLDAQVRGFTKNAAGARLKELKSEAVSEAFLSGEDGTKVAFLSKPTNWCHKGKPKHDVPMTGKSWQGPVEVDESTGLQQLQISVPVLDGGKPIGSLVVGLSLSKLGS